MWNHALNAPSLQTYHRLRCRFRLDDQPPLRVGERSSCHPWHADRAVPALHHHGHHAGVLDQLRLPAAHQRPGHVPRAAGHAGPPRHPPPGRYAPVQRVPTLARPPGPLGSRARHTSPSAPPAPTHPYVEREFQDIVAQLEHERQLIGGSGPWDLMREMWTIPGNRKRALISIFLMICQQMTGTNAINYYAPQIFKNLGVTGNATGLFATGVYGIVKVVGCAVFLVFVADSLGRRRSLLWTSVAQGLTMLYIGLYVRIAPPVAGEPVIPAGYVALVCIFLFAACFQFGWGPVCWIYVSEIPTARLRGLNVSFAAATQWLFNFVVARAVPNMLATVGANGYGYLSLSLSPEIP